MDEISVQEIKERLGLNQICFIRVSIQEEVEGCFQLKDSSLSQIESVDGDHWINCKGSPSNVGNHNPKNPLFKGEFTILTSHQINLDWFKKKFDEFLESEEFCELEGDMSSFVEFGLYDGDFYFTSEMGLTGEGVNTDEIKESLNTSLYFNEFEVETGIIEHVHDLYVTWEFE